MAYAYDISGDMDFLSGASTAMDYILGRNPLEQSYITGYGEHATTYPHHRFWSYQLDPTFPMAPAGVLSGGPNSAMQDPWIKGMGYKVGTIAPQLCYLDHIESWSTNEVTINWNAPLAWTVRYLEDVVPTAEEGKQAAYVAGEDVTPPEDTDVTTTEKVDDTTESTTSKAEDTDVTTTAKVEDTTVSNTTVDPSTTTLPDGADLSKVLWGDVNVDGIVDIRDVTTLNQYLIKAVDLTGQGKLNADVINDGAVDVSDLGQIKKYILKLISKF
jgi:endoglucanase